VLHQSPALTVDRDLDQQARATELRRMAERSLGMARVLAAGGFTEEALPLIGKAVGAGAAARLADLGELAAGASIAGAAHIRDLVGRGLLPRGAEMALAAFQPQRPAGGAHEIAELISLIETDVLASAGRVETGAKRAA
jgi:hypothetical protein